ncbi:hypothetical protein LUX57_40935 [Actinomadura madurae]|uniref:hypothetical protein n=1 Tax=Actinomadura madurae TaxID=1993 RepID=UPI0020D24317|nr:hypothetical protein [Actinomadura madurae]MCP9970753.1 hypothetical protein [Actinomadura madurae]
MTLLTDRPGAHPFDGAVVECDVSDFRDIIARIDGEPAAVFSNSDFLQAPAALAAAYFGLPAKDWRAATRAKNKALLRRHLASIDPVFSADAFQVPADAPFPLVVKPREGVASEDVFLVQDAGELAARVEEIAARRSDPPCRGGVPAGAPPHSGDARRRAGTTRTGVVPYDALPATLLRRRAP